jgi:diguanylate cyclase (GGDEF)-like protein
VGALVAARAFAAVASSFRARLVRLVLLTLLPTFACGAALILAVDPSSSAAVRLLGGMSPRDALWWWLLASSVTLAGGLGLARRLAGQLERVTMRDGLTGLVNRECFDAALSVRLAECERRAGHLAVLYIDVDGFKRINDLHGHAAGDDLLRLFAARLRSGVRESEVVARLGGDEFAVLIDHATQTQALQAADGLIDRLSRPYRVDHLLLEVSASIGLACYPTAGTCARTLMAAADEAMYSAKRRGKRRFVASLPGLPSP